MRQVWVLLRVFGPVFAGVRVDVGVRGGVPVLRLWCAGLFGVLWVCSRWRTSCRSSVGLVMHGLWLFCTGRTSFLWFFFNFFVGVFWVCFGGMR